MGTVSYLSGQFFYIYILSVRLYWILKVLTKAYFIFSMWNMDFFHTPIYFDYHIGINTAPVITNLPLASPISVPENSALSASVFQVSVSDVNTGDTHTYSASYNPGLGSTLFSFNTASEYTSLRGPDGCVHFTLRRRVLYIDIGKYLILKAKMFWNFYVLFF